MRGKLETAIRQYIREELDPQDIPFYALEIVSLAQDLRIGADIAFDLVLKALDPKDELEWLKKEDVVKAIEELRK